MNQTKKLHPAVVAVIVIVLIGIVATVAIVVNNNQGSDSNTSGTTDSAVQTSSTDTAAYKDGTYDATGSYVSPGGRESIELKVTIKDGIITDTAVVKNATGSEAKQYQTLFADNYKTLVVGKKISEVASLSRVAGSSLTSNGFNDALDQIKNDARV